MTAEIAILNKHAVALAADSAVTVQMRKNDEIKQKIFNTSNKLFTLSKFHPVGIMFYGEADILQIPLEILTKMYRKKLGTKNYKLLKDYALDFIDFVGNSFSEEQQKEYFKSKISSFFFHIILKEINDKGKSLAENGQLTEENVIRISSETIKQCYEKYKDFERLDHLPEKFEETIMDIYKEQIVQAIKDVFEELPLKKSSIDELFHLASFICSRDLFPSNITGIVIAGYGSDQIFPSIYGIIIDGVTGNKLKYKVTHEIEISESNNSTIIPFAQKEMVSNFMEGVDPDYGNLFNSMLKEIITQYPIILINKISNLNEEDKENIIKPLLEESIEIYNKLKEKMLEYRQNNFIDPVIDAVSALSKEDLAEMAESLVNLTSFKRRVTIDAETVGGPIDVAVISKGDGFIWIKRKHYFDINLNHHFLTNYFKNYNGDNND